jgi:hypothetical protein
MQIEISGLSELDKELADQLWTMDTEAEVQEFISQLPRSLRVRAETVFQLIVLAAIDQGVAEIQQFDEVSEYLHKFG